ncbi:MAG: twin-arginine translocation signal domain-containing protein, partial [Anaerolineales bacterium]|nr:twin-arginine translocation signal domain-containing protein [Anaerolineales bacterium]
MSEKEELKKKDSISRRDFIRVAGLAGASASLAACAQPTPEPEQPAEGEAPAEVEAPMPLKGTKIKVLLSDFNFSRFLDEKAPEFTEATGIEVEAEIVTFPILLEQSEIELSSGSSNYDA